MFVIFEHFISLTQFIDTNNLNYRIFEFHKQFLGVPKSSIKQRHWSVLFDS